MSKPDVANERKAQIVSATVECISNYGYHNFSMQDVARIAGVSKGIIHYYFLNKDDLMMSVLDKVAEDIEQVLNASMEQISDPAEKLKAFIRVCMQVVCTKREYYQVNMDFWTQINQKEEVRHAIANHYSKFRDTCSVVIREGISQGQFIDLDPKYYSSYIISVVDGLSLQWLFDNSQFDFDAMVDSSVGFLIQGILRKD